MLNPRATIFCSVEPPPPSKKFGSNGSVRNKDHSNDRSHDFADGRNHSATPIVYQVDRPGEHKVKIELVDANHNVFPGQSVTLDFTVPEHAKKH